MSDPIDTSSIPLLKDLAPDVRAAVVSLMSVEHVRAGDNVFEQDEPARALYVLRAGEAEVVKRAHGHEMVINRLRPVTVFGGIGVLRGRPHSATVRACTDLEVVEVPAEFVEIVRERDPAALTEIYRQSFTAAADLLHRADLATVGYFVDLLARREQEQLERELRHLLVHDLRSPLAICEAGITQLLEQRDRMGPLTAKQERALKRSRRSAIFMRGLIDEILEVARTEGGSARLTEVSLRDVLFEALTQAFGGVQGPDLDDVEVGDFDGLRRRLAAQNVDIVAEAATLSRTILIDRFRFVQVLMNLVGNASKHAPGWLGVRLRDLGPRLEIAVVDRGPGIPEHLRAAVFELYRQVDLKNQGVRRGFGLGLAGAARLVAALGGQIRVADGDGGVGTAMIVEVPWAPSTSAGATR